jgi:hypothetical protein
MREQLKLVGTAFLLAVLFAFTPHAARAHGTSSSQLSVDNGRDVEALVLVDRAWIGSVKGRTRTTFTVAAGQHKVELRTRDGQSLLVQDLNLRPGQVGAVQLVARTGTVVIDNHTGTRLIVSVDGRATGDVDVGEHRNLPLDAGVHRISLSYVQLGRERVLETRSVQVQQGRSTTMAAEPVDFGLVRIDNHTGRQAELRIDGMPASRLGLTGSLAINESREVRLPLGRHDLVLVDARTGSELDRLSFNTIAFRDHSWTAAAPRIGDLVLTNPLPMAVLVEVPGRSDLTLAAGQSRTLVGLPVGSMLVSFHRLGGETLADLRVAVAPYEQARLVVPVPNMGVVEVTNHTGRGAIVRVDGRTTSTLQSGQAQRLSLSPGDHRVELVDERGRRLESRMVRIDRYVDQRLDLGAPALSCDMPHDGHDHYGSSGHSASSHVDSGDRWTSSATHQRP